MTELPTLADLITAEMPGAESLEVFNTETGLRAEGLVRAVSLKEGWIDRCLYAAGGKTVIFDDAAGEVATERVEGPWGLRLAPKTPAQV